MEENEKNIPATPVPEAENGVTTEAPSVEAPARTAPRSFG